MIEVDRLVKRFGTIEAVRDVSFTVAEGEIVGFLGPNGAGKTTTMRILAGIFPPTSGQARIAGRDVLAEPMACRRAVGYFPEHAPHYPELRVVEYLQFAARMKRLPAAGRRAAVERALEAVDLGGVARRRVGTLSKGYRQRVGLAQALLGDPAILILDEPTIGLDPGQVVEMRELVRGLRGARTVLFSSHILSEVQALCERVIVLARGRVVGEGSTASLAGAFGARQRVVVRLAVAADAAHGTLATLAGVHRVDRRGEAFVVESAGGGDLARRVGEAALRAGWVVLELRDEAIELEDVFLELVRVEARA